MTRPFRRTAALALALLVLVPTMFFAAPHPAHAIPVEVDQDVAPSTLGNWFENTFSAVKEAITAVASVTSAAKDTALVIERYILQPIAYVVTGNVLKGITSAMLGFVGGNNALGSPLYIKNSRAFMQNVSDVEASTFLSQFGQTTNSPFTAGLTSSLRANYLQLTSLAGFFAGNKCTLQTASPNINAFLSGNWSYGGPVAWFALTTQDQNNPYTEYYLAQGQLSRSIGLAQGAKKQQLDWARGFLSWCGDTSNQTFSSAPLDPCKSQLTPADVLACQQSLPGGSLAGLKPGDSCTQSDGTEGEVKTPGSVIGDYLFSSLKATGIDKLIAGAGDLSTQVNSILGDLATVMNTVNMATSLFGGSAGGLASFSPGATPSPFGQYLNTATFNGVSAQNIGSNPTTNQAGGGDLLARATQYQTSWTILNNAALAAQTSLNTLASSCPTQAGAANAAFSALVQPVLTDVTTANNIVQAAQTLYAQVQAEGAAGSNAYTADISKLVTAEPTAAQVASAEQESQSSGGAYQSTPGSLTIYGGTTMDRLLLVKQTADSITGNPVLCQ